MIQVRSTPAAQAEAWPDTVVACGGHALHLPAVQRTEHADGDMLCLEFVTEDEVVGCALVCVVQPRRWKKLLGKSSQWTLPTAPALKDTRHAPGVRAALFGLARDQGVSRVTIHPAGSECLVGDEDLEPYRRAAITEFVLDLGEGVERAHAAMHKNHRKNIRRARRDGVAIVEDSSLDGLLALRELQLASSQRANARADGFSVPEVAFFERAHAEVYDAGIGSVLLAQKGGKTVAALAWLQHGVRAQTVRSGSLPEGYQSYAMYLLYSDLIERLVDRRAVELNAGGVPAAAALEDHPQHGLFEFKKGFGGRIAPRYVLDLPLDEVVDGVRR